MTARFDNPDDFRGKKDIEQVCVSPMTLAEFTAAFAALPEGFSQGVYEGKSWSVSREVKQGGKQQKLYARELGGKDFVSLNLYYLSDGTPKLKPCEMPALKVIDFVLGVKIDEPQA